MKRTLIPNLIGAQCDAFFMYHKAGVFSRKDFLDHILSKKTLALNNSEAMRLFDEFLRCGVVLSKNQRTFVISDKRITNWSVVIDNIRTKRVRKPKDDNHVREQHFDGPHELRDYINTIKSEIEKADLDRLSEIQEYINLRKAAIEEQNRIDGIVSSLLSLAECENKAQLIELINKSTLN